MSDQSYKDIRVDALDGIAHVTLNRPPVNALTLQMYKDLTAIFDSFGEDDAVRCVILRGEGDRAFSAGFDFKLFSESGVEDDSRRPVILRGMLESIRNCRLPVVAAINGAAIGAGCVVAAACDVCVASESACFSLPEIDFGRVGGSAYVGSRVTKGLVRYMALTGRKIFAHEAHRCGLVDFVVPSVELDHAVANIARDIAGKSAQVLRHTKHALNRIENLSINDGYEIEQMHSMMARAGLEDTGQ